MILSYIYDGTFEGLLTSVYEAYYNRENVEEIVSANDFAPSLLHESKFITTDITKADKVFEAIRMKISGDALQNIYYVFLSSVPNSDTLIYNYIRLGFKLGKDIDLHLHNDIVLGVQKIRQKVSYESHNMLGFIRFRKISDNLYYSDIEPDHNILGLVAPHFADRMADQQWIIHDVRREIAAVYNCKEWIITEMEKDCGFRNSNSTDNFYEILWKNYFVTLAIEERKNPKLQKLHMPVRYWKHLTEMQ